MASAGKMVSAILGHPHTHHLHVADFIHALLRFMKRALAREKREPGVQFYNLTDDDPEWDLFDFLLSKNRRRGLIGWCPLFGLTDIVGSMPKRSGCASRGDGSQTATTQAAGIAIVATLDWFISIR